MTNKVTVSISTLSNRIEDISLIQNNQVDYLVIHQLPMNEVGNHFPFCKVIRLKEKGLSISRNLGLKTVDTKYLYIMDDDVCFNPDNILRLVNIMEKESVDVGTCQHQYENGAFPVRYKDSPFEHTLLSAAKVSSIDICVNVNSIREASIQFDEDFGLGTNLPSGEEYIFLASCIKKGLKVKYYPILVGIHPNITSGMDFYSDSAKVLAKRKMLQKVFGVKSFFYICAFWFKKVPAVISFGYFWSFTKTIFFGVR